MKKRYEELDSLRGIAALMVVFFHYTMGKDIASLGFKYGTTGVDLFFIISGFVIIFSLENVLNYRQFIANRISRLYPTYWASVTFTLLLLVGYGLFKNNFNNISLLQYAINLTMFQFYFRIPDIDGPYWTMIIEMLFYIVMVMLFQFKLLKHLDVIFITISILIVCMTQFYFENIWVKRIFLGFPLFQFLPLFHAGTLFYRLKTKKISDFTSYSLILICLVCQVLLFKFSGRSKDFIEFSEYAVILAIYFFLFVLFVNQKLSFVVNHITLFLGKISFALYLIHQKLSIVFIIPLLHSKFHIHFWIASFVALVCSITVASAITYLIEIPYSKKMKETLYAAFSISSQRRSTKYQVF